MRKFLLAAIGAAMLMMPATGFAVPEKYKKYIKQSLQSLLLMCVEGDDKGCYFYGGMQAKRGNYKEALDAYLIGAQNATDRAGFVCMFKVARFYHEGRGVERDLVQAYRWYSILTRYQPAKDLRSAAAAKLQELVQEMTPKQIALAEALAKSWKPKARKKKL